MSCRVVPSQHSLCMLLHALCFALFRAYLPSLARWAMAERGRLHRSSSALHMQFAVDAVTNMCW